ncbi:hypothetical protein AB8A31_24755 [Tardiphaga sp. 804_B3_N1_9]|uniref:hypothetical protein n=1 Tax=Tardiphaga TaxID=1395974 RepID=UPI001586A2FC|nr:hypothetical protein [Tardiphaga robiniae]NUU44240.1 hypothetical protein [Tardiphaga robiniae]
MSDPTADSVQLKVLVTIIPGVLGFVGSWIGAQVALSNFKQQRAFDKKLDWYERSARSLQSLAQNIEVAATAQEEEGTDPEHLENVWRDVQRGHIELEGLAFEAGFYGSAPATELMDKIRLTVENVAEQSEAFDPAAVDAESRDDALGKIIDLSAELRATHKPLVAEGRKHLGLDELSWFEKLKTMGRSK